MRSIQTYHNDPATGLLVRRGGAPTGPAEPTVLLSHNFDDWALGAYNTSTRAAFWNSQYVEGGGGGMGGGSNTAGTPHLDNIEVVNDTVHGGRVLRHWLRANGTGGGYGAAMVIPLKQEVTAATFEIGIRLQAGFDWGWGGKFPGLAGTAPGISVSLPSGGNSTFDGTQGWSCRHMWHGYDPPNGGYYYRTQGEASDYIYDRESHLAGATYGQNLYFGTVGNPPGTTRGIVTPDVDHVIKTTIVMNTPGVADGILHTTYDDEVVIDRTNRLWRTRNDVKIKHIYWSIFRGGSGLDWESTDDWYVDFNYVHIESP